MGIPEDRGNSMCKGSGARESSAHLGSSKRCGLGGTHSGGQGQWRGQVTKSLQRLVEMKGLGSHGRL